MCDEVAVLSVNNEKILAMYDFRTYGRGDRFSITNFGYHRLQQMRTPNIGIYAF